VAVAAHSLGRSPGTYILVISLERPHIIEIGRQGRFRLPAGFYLYVGSALGPGGLAARLERHLRADKHIHWHVDYLLECARVVEAWIVEGSERRECAGASAALRLPGARIAVPHFGASDCQCASHLITFDRKPNRNRFALLTGDRVERWVVG
jgi:Uri superfamily endonuclease